tara:strand:- start:548 stop:1252 length:705 start_codon:yes stop_codon:yes gene_type:complete
MSELERNLSLELTESFPFNAALYMPRACRYTKWDARHLTERLRELLLSEAANTVSPLYDVEALSSTEVKIRSTRKHPRSLLGWHKDSLSWDEFVALWGHGTSTNIIRYKVAGSEGLYRNVTGRPHILPPQLAPRGLKEAKKASRLDTELHKRYYRPHGLLYQPSMLAVPANLAAQKQVHGLLNFILDPYGLKGGQCARPHWTPVRPSKDFELYFYREHILAYSTKEQAWTLRTR